MQSIDDFSNPNLGKNILCNFRKKSSIKSHNLFMFLGTFIWLYCLLTNSLFATEKTGYRANGQSVLWLFFISARYGLY